MRLDTDIKNKLVALSKRIFGAESKLYLFGSRVYDYKKGGDIDLFVETDLEIKMEHKIEFLVAAEKEITARKIDLVVKPLIKGTRVYLKPPKKRVFSYVERSAGYKVSSL